jgi:hypothetical protein
LRAVAGLGLAGAAIGVVVSPFADLLWHVFMMGDEVLFYPQYWLHLFGRLPGVARDWAMMGGFTGSSFGALLLATREKRRIEDLPLLQMGALGALGGSLFLVVYSALQGNLWWLYDNYLPVAATGLVGAGLTTGMVTLAKLEERAAKAAALREVLKKLES